MHSIHVHVHGHRYADRQVHVYGHVYMCIDVCACSAAHTDVYGIRECRAEVGPVPGRTQAQDMCIDMCEDMCVDMCEDMCIDMCDDMCVDMLEDKNLAAIAMVLTAGLADTCVHMCPDMRLDVCMDICVDMNAQILSAI